METPRRILVMLVVCVVMLFAFFALRGLLGGSSDPAQPPPDPLPRVIAAKRDIPQGSIVNVATDLDWLAVEPSTLQETHLREGQARIEEFQGAIVRRPLRAGEAVTAAALTRVGEGSLMSAVLEPGMRAVSIGVSATSGNAGFISPGDRVDLLVTHRVRAGAGGGNLEGSVVSETFIHDVRVIAVDQMLDNPDNKATLAKTVTIEVTPEQAERIAVAGDLGKVSLTLRSLATPEPPPSAETAKSQEKPAEETDESKVVELKPVESPIPEASDFTRDKDVSQALNGNAVAPTIRVIRGDQVETISLQ